MMIDTSDSQITLHFNQKLNVYFALFSIRANNRLFSNSIVGFVDPSTT